MLYVYHRAFDIFPGREEGGRRGGPLLPPQKFDNDTATSGMKNNLLRASCNDSSSTGIAVVGERHDPISEFG